jgi:hypothetical protein
MKKIILFSMIFTISFYGCTHLRLEHSNPLDPLYSGPAVTNPVIPTNGLIMEWLFNGNANDTSGNGNNGTAYNTVLTNDRFGNALQAYYFNGINGYVRKTPEITLEDNSFTWSCWIKISSLPLPGTSAEFINEGGNPGAGGISPSISIDSNRVLCFTLYQDVGIYCNLYSIAKFNYNWYFISAIYDNNKCQIYINSMLDSEQNYSQGWGSSVNWNFYVGANPAYNFYTFKGLVDDVRIYNRALSGDEIWALYHEGGW